PAPPSSPFRHGGRITDAIGAAAWRKTRAAYRSSPMEEAVPESPLYKPRNQELVNAAIQAIVDRRVEIADTDPNHPEHADLESGLRQLRLAENSTRRPPKRSQ